ncbi:hypothetical protein D9M69_457630 [compost metagenome]
MSDENMLAGLVDHLSGADALPDDDAGVNLDGASPDLIADVQAFEETHDLKETGREFDADVPRASTRVPLAALQADRRQRQEFAAQLQAQEAELQQYRAMLAQAQAVQQQQAIQAAIPNFDEDPQGHMEARLMIQQAQMQQMAQQQVAHQQFQAAQSELGLFQNEAAQDEAQFRAQHSDYEDAFRYVAEGATQRMRAMHPQASEQQVQHAVGVLVVQHIADCRQRGVSPAAEVYRLAGELGYQGGGTVQSAQQSGPGAGATLEQVSAMSPQEFDAWFEAEVKGANKRNALAFG